MKGIIYKATNLLNGKVYIGQTVGSLAHRRGEHQHDAEADSANQFHVALYQYPGQFEWEVIDTFIGTREKVIHALNVAEEYHIQKYNSADERYGYNSTYGGYSSDKFTEQINRRLKAFGGSAKRLLQYDRDGNFIREFASLNEVAAFLKIGKASPKNLVTGLHYGCQWRVKENEYFPKKIGVCHATKGTAIAVYRNDGLLIGEYESRKDALAATGQKSANIREAIGDLEIREHQMRDFYFFRLGDTHAPNLISISIKRKQRRRTATKTDCRIAVACYSLDGELIHTYESMSEARRITGMTREAILRYCEMREPIVLMPNSKTKYVWQYSHGDPKQQIQIKNYKADKVTVKRWKYLADGTRVSIDVQVTKNKSKSSRKMEHRIIQYSLQGDFIKVWENANLAADFGAESSYTTIYKSLKGRQSRYANYIWRHYSDDYPQTLTNEKGDTEGIKADRKDDTILEIDKAGETIATYKDTSEAAKKSGFSQSYICNVLAGRIRHPKRLFKRTHEE